MRTLAFINRAVPGSGKTAMTKYMTRSFDRAAIPYAVHSTDEFFMTPDGRYSFDSAKLDAYHRRNLQDFVESLQTGVAIVFCDNINLLPWQTDPYTQAARAHGYMIVFLNFSPRDLQEHLETQRVTPERPEAHGVPEDTIVRFMEEYHLFNDLLDPSTPIDPERHANYTWDPVACERLKLETPSKHFDLDVLVQIDPDNFDEHKIRLPHRTLDWLNGAETF